MFCKIIKFLMIYKFQFKRANFSKFFYVFTNLNLRVFITYKSDGNLIKNIQSALK